MFVCVQTSKLAVCVSDGTMFYRVWPAGLGPMHQVCPLSYALENQQYLLSVRVVGQFPGFEGGGDSWL